MLLLYVRRWVQTVSVHQSSTCIWEDNIKVDNKIGWKDMVWIHLAQDRDCQHALVNVAMNGPHKMLGISWPSKRLLDCEGLSSIESYSFLTWRWRSQGIQFTCPVKCEDTITQFIIIFSPVYIDSTSTNHVNRLMKNKSNHIKREYVNYYTEAAPNLWIAMFKERVCKAKLCNEKSLLISFLNEMRGNYNYYSQDRFPHNFLCTALFIFNIW